MSRRLSPQRGEWIDRDAPVSFTFEGRPYSGFRGDTLSSALLANGVRVTGRSFKYHRPRGPYSLANHDAHTLVEDAAHPASHRTNLRGDELAIHDGLDVNAVNTFGSLARDRMRIVERFSAFLPVGFYYKTFFRPRWLFPFHERQMRKVAGLGRINPEARTPPSPKDYAFCDLLVIGSGPSGLSAALAAADCGVGVCLVEEQPRLGGSLTYQFPPDQRTAYDPLIERVRDHANIDVRTATTAGGWYTDHWVALFDEERLTKLRAGALLVATGAIEQPAVFQNNDLPGIMLGSAFQRLIRRFAVKPCDRCVVLTANRSGYRAALDLAGTGVDVAAVIDLRPAGEPTDLAAKVEQLHIPVRRGHGVAEAVADRGGNEIAAVRIGALDRNGAISADNAELIACDGLAVSVGWMPSAGLLYQAGGRFTYAQEVEQLVPGPLPDGVLAAGRINGVFEVEQRIADGRRAGLAAAQYLGRNDVDLPDPVVHRGPAPSHPYPIFAHPGQKNFVDFDEDLHLADFANAHQEGYDNIELLKRYTTVGMGPSQGKLSNMNAVRILARLNGRSIDETGTTTSRPFHHPVRIAHLAGRRFHPMRRTPIHRWHARHDAEFFHAGSWVRPEYYRRAGRPRERCILDEAANVRRGLGIIDVGTLGKLTINGPDAAALLDRLYTGRFSTLKVGRYRYGVGCDETGVVIEDGVMARLAEDRFYVTATSSGVEAFFREMQRWALIWKLDVTLINLTAELAAMNIAGPVSREVLAPLTDVDLSAEAFPYVGARAGTVAGAPAILMRVGFVGELGFEVHVPASHGLHVWTTLFEAGGGHGIRPFGVEAQRLLRLEKGHLIVSQDTDALTNPHEADVAWAIGKDKPFFVGQRGIDALTRSPLERKLVGVRWPDGYKGPLPDECHLVIAGGRVAGRITSIAHASTLGYPLGMALIRTDLAQPGTRVAVRAAGGTLTAATVVKLPHYDPDNERQKM